MLLLEAVSATAELQHERAMMLLLLIFVLEDSRQHGLQAKENQLMAQNYTGYQMAIVYVICIYTDLRRAFLRITW